MPVKKDHYIYCPGGDCTCPPMPQTQKVDVKKVLKSLDSMNKAKPCPVTMPVVKPKPKVAIPKITKKVIDPEVTYNKFLSRPPPSINCIELQGCTVLHLKIYYL